MRGSEKILVQLSLFLTLAAPCALAQQTPLKKDARYPHLLWHNAATGQNRMWLMSGTNLIAQHSLPSTGDDLAWRMVGSGDFNSDSMLDIVWQNDATGQNMVWLMRGTNRVATALIESVGDLDWKLACVADFNGDSMPDLVLQNIKTAENSVWLMKGAKRLSYNMIASNGDPKWRIFASADVNGDGKPDLFLRNVDTGQYAVWYFDGLKMTAGELLRSANGTEAVQSDHDWQIVGTDDYNGDGKPDLFWRHSVLGVHACWYLNGAVVVGAAYVANRDGNTDWKVSGQDTADSTWRLKSEDYTWVRARVYSAPNPKVALSFKLGGNPAFGATVQRRTYSQNSWSNLVTGLKTNTYLDLSVPHGDRYEYKVFREGSGGTINMPEHLSVAVDAPPLESRGKVILLVDQTLTKEIATGLQQLSQDLVGDGWQVVRHDVPRHVDDYSSPAAFRVNAFNIINVIKPLIRSAYESDPASTKAIFIIGHVAIPYSGSFSVDGHSCASPAVGPDHRGAWPADLYYGDLDGVWTDNSVNLTNCHFAEATNLPGDGRFDQDGLPSPYVLKLAVGRVDFAKLPHFTSSPPAGVAARSEADLINQYLRKDHLYRLNRLPWQRRNPAPRAQVYGHFHDSRDTPIFENAARALPSISESPAALAVGDFCLQRNRPWQWAFLAGAGAPDRVNNSIFGLEHTAAELADPANEPTAAFYMVLGSYLGDWNLGNNNYLRSLLATPTFGLASIWTRFALWRLDAMGVGEHLGEALKRMVNEPKNTFYERSREVSIMGDPTLRLHVLPPPINVRASKRASSIDLRWSGTETNAFYYVYRGPKLTGPFTRISREPVSTSKFTDSSPDESESAYMVRTIKPMTVGTGSYTNISQGAFVVAD